jgi:predicted amidohydrolase
MSPTRLAALQLDIVWMDRAANYEKVRRFARTARAEGADLLVLPEMFATGYSTEVAFTAEDEDGPTPDFLRTLARELDLALLAGLVLRAPDGRGLNVSMAVDRGGRVQAVYAKTHLFTYAGEDRVHAPGPGPLVYDAGELRVAPLVCYDLRFPELFREVAEATDLYALIASWPHNRQRHWDLLLPARAVENQAYIVGVNRCGEGGGLLYKGGSAIYSPWGERIAHAGEGEGLISAEVDATVVEHLRARLPFLKDRRR